MNETETWVESVGGFNLPILRESKRKSNSTASVENYTEMLEYNFLKVPEAFENPQEACRIALQSVRRNEWQTSTPALINLMQISRFHPELLDSNMPLINRSLCSLLRNTRAQIIRTACQVATELYKTVQYTQRPEFDELVAMLLLKSTHTKKGIRDDAERALDSMLRHLPPSTTVRVLASEHGAGQKNPLIRATVSSLLRNVVEMIGSDCLLSNGNLKEIRGKIIKTCAKFLLDGNSDTRNNAKRILKSMVGHTDFDTLFHQDVDRRLAENVEKQIVSLKYN